MNYDYCDGYDYVVNAVDVGRRKGRELQKYDDCIIIDYSQSMVKLEPTI